MYSCMFCTVVNDCGWEAKGTITIAMEFEAAGKQVKCRMGGAAASSCCDFIQGPSLFLKIFTTFLT